MESTPEEQRQILGITFDELYKLRAIDRDEFEKKIVEIANRVYPGDEEVRAITLRHLRDRRS